MAGLSRRCPACGSLLRSEYVRVQQRKMYLPVHHVNPRHWKFWCPRCQRYVQ